MSAIVLASGAVAWGQQLEVKKDTWLATTGGNVGIGTTSPQALLEVYSGADGSPLHDSIQNTRPNYPQLILNATNGAANAKIWRMIGRSSNLFEIQTLGDNYGNEHTAMQVVRNGYLVSSVSFPLGDVGIGTTAPVQKLDVENGYLQVGNHGSGTWDASYVSLHDNDTAKQWRLTMRGSLESNYDDFGLFFCVDSPWSCINPLTVDQSGNVGIGTTSPNYKLEVNGAAAGTSWTNLSSRSYKEEIRRVSKPEQRQMLDTLMRMKPSRYKYKPRYGGDGEEKLGFIAEEMPKEVLSKNGKGVDVYELQTLTIAALKAAERQIDTQRGRIAAQQRQMDSQRDQIVLQRRELRRQEQQIEKLLAATHSTFRQLR